MANIAKILFAIVFLLISSSSWGAKDELRWVEETNDPELWAMARVILKEELAPDDPKKMPAHVGANEYKYINRIMKEHDSVLVLIAEATNKSHVRSLDYFKAFTIDLKTRRKSTVGKKGFMQWKFVKWANFDHSPVPDTVFRNESCVECEASSLIGSFQFDSQANQWKIREWPDIGTDVLVGDYWHGDDDDYSTTCMYSIQDMTNDGRDDIATYCQTKGHETGKQPAIATLYTVTSSGPKKRILVSVEAATLKKNLCKKNFEKRLCKY